MSGVLTTVLLILGAGVLLGVLYLATSGKLSSLRDATTKRLQRKPAPTDFTAVDTIAKDSDLPTISPSTPKDPYDIILGYSASKNNLGTLHKNPSKAVLVRAERWLPILCLGATGSGKSTGFVIPSILGWPGSALSTTVKTDICFATIAHREKVGPVYCFDPAQILIKEQSARLRNYARPWTPLAAVVNWESALAMARAIISAHTSSGDGGAGGGSDDFWIEQATLLLAILLFAAREGLTDRKPPKHPGGPSGATMRDVVRALKKVGSKVERKVDGKDATVPGFVDIALTLGEQFSKLLDAAEKLEEATDPASREQFARLQFKASDYESAELAASILANYAGDAPATSGGVTATTLGALRVYITSHEADCRWDDPDLIDVEKIIAEKGTLYVLGPPRAQKLYAPVFTALVSHYFDVAYRMAALNGGKLEIPTLAALDEVVNVAPIPELDSLVSTARSYQIQMLVVSQDLEGIVGKLGKEKASTIISNAGTVLILPRSKGLDTLEWTSTVFGETRANTFSRSESFTKTEGSGRGVSGGVNVESTQSEATGWTETKGQEWRPLASKSRIASMGDKEALAIIGAKRAHLIQRRAHEDPAMKLLVRGLGSLDTLNTDIVSAEDSSLEELELELESPTTYTPPPSSDPVNPDTTYAAPNLDTLPAPSYDHPGGSHPADTHPGSTTTPPPPSASRSLNEATAPRRSEPYVRPHIETPPDLYDRMIQRTQERWGGDTDPGPRPDTQEPT